MNQPAYWGREATSGATPPARPNTQHPRAWRHPRKTRSDLNFSRSDLVFLRRHLVPPQSCPLSPAPRKITRRARHVQIKSVYLPMNPYAGATTVAVRRDSIYQERRLLALCPWLLGTSQTPNIQSTNIATVDAHWVCYMPARGAPQRAPRGSFTYIHIGVGFCVARSGCMGNAKASKSGTATIQTPALFRIYATTLSKPFRPGEFGGNNKKITWKK